MNTREIFDIKAQQYRKPNYKDIVILERSYGQARKIQQAFKDHNIPFHVNSKEGYFEQTEVQLILSFKNDRQPTTRYLFSRFNAFSYLPIYRR